MELKIQGKTNKEIQQAIKDNLRLPSMRDYVRGEVVFKAPTWATVKFSKFRNL